MVDCRRKDCNAVRRQKKDPNTILTIQLLISTLIRFQLTFFDHVDVVAYVAV